MAEWFPLSIEQRASGDLVVLGLHGHLAVEAGTTLSDAVDALLLRGTRRLVVDLTDVSWLDAAGLGEIASIRNRIVEARGELRLIVAGRAVREPLERSHLLDALQVFPIEAEAIASLSRATPRRPRSGDRGSAACR